MVRRSSRLDGGLTPHGPPGQFRTTENLFGLGSGDDLGSAANGQLRDPQDGNRTDENTNVFNGGGVQLDRGTFVGQGLGYAHDAPGVNC